MLDVSKGTKRCSRCGLVRRLSEFNISSEFGYQFYCRDCQSGWYADHRVQHLENVGANSQRYRARNTSLVHEYLLDHPCVDCGEDDPLVLEFDHVATRGAWVSRLVGSAPPERLMAEVAKCEVRCVNCHMRRTAQQFGWFKAKVQG